MSFILDALRKSEHERQRQSGPALVEPVAATQKTRTNRWATAAIALLVVNLLAIGVLLMLRSGEQQSPAATEPQPQPAATAPQAGTPATPPAAAATPPPATPDVARPATKRTPPMLSPAMLETSGRNPLENEVVDESVPPANEALAQAAMPPEGPPAVVQAPPRRGTVVYQSLPDADPVTSLPPPASHRNLPTADEMAARGGLPELRLELHVYSSRPAERLVFVNGQRYREGETTREGAVVEEITIDGVVMSLQGNRFLLPRE